MPIPAAQAAETAASCGPCRAARESPRATATAQIPLPGRPDTTAVLDIDGFGNDGAPIVAAASGVVVTASSDSGYGNYVIINHGDTSTVYAHMSGFAVSTGDYVSQGQTVGYLGQPEEPQVRICILKFMGDGRVDPAAYFSGITYYNC